MHDHKISFSHDRSRFILQRWRSALDEIEETVATRRDMSAVLDVVGRPVTLGRNVVTLIEQRVESFEDETFIFRFNRLPRSFFHTFLPNLFSALLRTTAPP